MKVYLTRHAEDEKTCSDGELTSRGRAQAETLADYLHKRSITHLYCSNLKRAIQTAEAVSTKTGKKYIVSSIFREHQTPMSNEDEIKYGIVQQGNVDMSVAVSSGETYEELLTRARNAWQWLLDRHSSDSDDVVCVVSHGKFMTFLLAVILNIPEPAFSFTIPNTGIAELRFSANWVPQLALCDPCLEF